MNNPIFEALCNLGICDSAAVTPFHQGTRDKAEINVLQCAKSGALFLDDVAHMDIGYYNAKPPTHKHGTQKRAIITTNDDTRRRYAQFANLLRGKSWLDIGAGSGAMLDVFAPLVTEYAAVEPQAAAAAFLRDLGHRVYQHSDDVPEGQYAVVTLFHVFEHLTDPVGVLKSVYDLMPAGGRLIIEVPHARDLLISFARSEAFCAHTFWSEHLFLHTRETLRALTEAAGFETIAIQGVQRYPVANHLHWLAEGKPAGHVHWNMLVDDTLDTAYGNVLARLDLTDTLTLEARKPA